jgi:hypothetical protein
VNKEEYLVLAATSGSDIALNKKVLAANEILKFIRRGNCCRWPIFTGSTRKWWKSWRHRILPSRESRFPK